LTVISYWTLITTGLRIFAKGLLNVETLNIHFHRTPHPLFPRFTSSLSFAFEVVGWFVVAGEAGC
jgi:hypothetical protein